MSSGRTSASPTPSRPRIETRRSDPSTSVRTWSRMAPVTVRHVYSTSAAPPTFPNDDELVARWLTVRPVTCAETPRIRTQTPSSSRSNLPSRGDARTRSDIAHRRRARNNGIDGPPSRRLGLGSAFVRCAAFSAELRLELAHFPVESFLPLGLLELPLQFFGGGVAVVEAGIGFTECFFAFDLQLQPRELRKRRAVAGRPGRATQRL